MSSMPFRQLKSFLKILIGVQYERLLGFQVQGHFVRQTKNALLKFVSKTQQSILLIIGLESNLQATCPF